MHDASDAAEVDERGGKDESFCGALPGTRLLGCEAHSLYESEVAIEFRWLKQTKVPMTTSTLASGTKSNGERQCVFFV